MKKALLFTILSTFLCSCAQKNSKGYELLDINSFVSRLEQTEKKQIIDVRTPEEFNEGNIPQAQNINIYDADFESKIEALDKTIPIFIYCKSGGRSANASQLLQEKGFKKVYELKGGMMAWEIAFPIGTATSQDEYTMGTIQKMASENQILLVDFYASWCAPCMRMKPIFEKIEAENHPGVKILRIDVDKSKKLVKSEKIEALPVIIVYKNSEKINTFNKELNELELRNLLK
jgi:rhodanese-related sulfurtransferase